MKHCNSSHCQAWFAERLVLSSGSCCDRIPIPDLIFLIDVQTRWIIGFHFVDTKTSLALMSAVQLAVKHHPAPDVVYTDIIPPSSADLFLPQRHPFSFLSTSASCPAARRKNDLTMRTIRNHLRSFPSSDVLPETVVESVIRDINSFRLKKLSQKEACIHGCY